MVDDETLKDFQNRLKMFESSFTNVTKDLLNKLDTLGAETKTIAESTSYLKRLKESYDESNKKLKDMDEVIEELMKRLDRISEEPYDSKKKKKKKKKK